MILRVRMAIAKRVLAHMQELALDVDCLEHNLGASRGSHSSTRSCLVKHADLISFRAHLELGHDAEPRKLVRVLAQLDLQVAARRFIQAGLMGRTNLVSSVAVAVGRARTNWRLGTCISWITWPYSTTSPRRRLKSSLLSRFSASDSILRCSAASPPSSSASSNVSSGCVCHELEHGMVDAVFSF